MTRNIILPVSREEVRKISAGDKILLTGIIYTARDAAHKRMIENKDNKGIDFPFEIEGSAIYFAGPAPAKPGRVIGSVGPTTSGRMDAHSPRLIKEGNLIMIGKGERNNTVVDAMVKYGAVYLAAPGGAGALMAQKVKSCKLCAYEDLGAEAVYELYVEEMPLIAVIDSAGRNLYDEVKKDL
ncbi:MAG: fumarate hydratase C-terminal domain-containing protein [Firmicutes bacterium]|nr:fumarate hydratase C-terminal domain-containing protein [Bacillota bacterium]